jgi:outer membrane protein assembly factor BamE (lipoprotein component of BamABCDE complex)
MKKRSALIATICFLVLGCLAGCATAPPRIPLGQKSTLLQIGMTKMEISQILGSPRNTAVRKDGESVVETWQYWNATRVGYMLMDDPHMAGAGNRLSVTFRDEKVESWGDQLDLGVIMDKNMQAMKDMQPIQVEQTIRHESKESQ